MDFHLNLPLTHLSLAFFLWDIGKQRKPRSDAAYRRLSLILNKNEKYHPTTLKTERTGSTNKNGEFHSAYIGSYHISLPNKAVVSIDRLQSTSYFVQLQFLKKATMYPLLSDR